MITYHFLIDSTYASDFIDFICDNYQEECHKFVVLTFLNERECVKNNKNKDKIDILFKNRQFIKYLFKIKIIKQTFITCIIKDHKFTNSHIY